MKAKSEEVQDVGSGNLGQSSSSHYQVRGPGRSDIIAIPAEVVAVRSLV